jgi:phthiodiolone/phenolphthiodiolone dimycocerosates ketoreductase
MQVGTNGTIVPPVEGIIRAAQRADEGPYDSIWWPDHLMAWHPQSIWDLTELSAFMPNPHIYVDTISALAAAAVHTERVLLGSSVTEPFRRHPAMLAQQFLTLDHFSRGRVIFGLGAGERENIEPYGLDFRRPVARFEEALTIIRLLWEHDDPVDFDGDFWQLRDAVVGMGPFRRAEGGTRRYPPIWSGAHGPRMLSIVGRLCDGWLPMYLGGLELWSEGLATIQDTAQAAGRDPATITPALYANVVVDDHPTEVERILDHPIIKAWQLLTPSWAYEKLGYRHPFGDDWNGFRDYVPARVGREEALKALEAVPLDVSRAYLLCGTPDEIVDELRAFERAGLRHVVLWNVTYMADVSKLRPSYHLLAEIARELKGPSSPD